MNGAGLRSYGIVEAPAGSGDPALALGLEELARNGFTVIEQALTSESVQCMSAALDRVLAEQAARAGGEAHLAEIGEGGQARALLEEDPVFLQLLRIPLLDAIVEALLGPSALVIQQNGIVMPPLGAAHHQQSWHRDLPYQSWVSSKPIALGSLCTLDPFTEESGATLFLPGAHKHEGFPSEAFIARWQRSVYAPAGAVVVFDAMTFHRGGVNRGSGPRRAVNTLFGVPLLAQQITLTPKPNMDDKLRRRLGLRYQPAASADAWRDARRRSLQGKPG